MEAYFEKNLKYLRAQKQLTQEQLAQELGLKRSLYKDYEYGKEPDLEILVKVSTYFNKSIDDIIKSDIEQSQKDIKIQSRDFLNNFRVLAVSIDNQGNENIEFIPIKARAGYLTGYANPEFIRDLQRFRLPSLPTGSYRAFEISGDSMPPLNNGTVIIGKYVENWKDIKNLHTYVFITRNEGIVYKRVINKIKDKGLLIMLSDNAAYEPYYVKIEEVMEVWSYYAHIQIADKFVKSNQSKMIEKLLEMNEEISGLDETIQSISSTLN
ncbi:MAG: helix-turn-helix domain-containing protein [Bacteroidota bacterium]|nr:helix-turn-helix domain-containing protein [Bacteroidota bacterium]